MIDFHKKFEVGWSDCDSNGNLRYSRYFDFAGDVHADLFNKEFGVSLKDMHKMKIAYVVLREFIEYKRESFASYILDYDLELVALSKDKSRWIIRHHVTHQDGICAVITLEGAFLDTVERKIIPPNEAFSKGFDRLKKSDDFYEMVGKESSLYLSLGRLVEKK